MKIFRGGPAVRDEQEILTEIREYLYADEDTTECVLV